MPLDQIKTSDKPNEGRTKINDAIEVMDAVRTGSDISDAMLIAWTESESYQGTSVTRDADGLPTSATIVWPDGSAGVFTRVSKNSTWLAVNEYTITHTDSGKTVTQPSLTWDAGGNMASKPALTVA